jgi:hypothetical protein
VPVIFVDGVSEAFIVYSFGYNLLSPRLYASHIRWRNEYTVIAQPWVSIVELRAGLRGDPRSSSQWGLIEGGLRQGYFSSSNPSPALSKAAPESVPGAPGRTPLFSGRSYIFPSLNQPFGGSSCPRCHATVTPDYWNIQQTRDTSFR